MNGTKIFILTRRDEHVVHVDLLRAKENMSAEQIEKAMRAAVAEYLSTDEGKQVAKSIDNWFNWGDAMIHVPSEIWKKHGIFIDWPPTETIQIDLNHNEILSNDDELDDDDEPDE